MQAGQTQQAELRVTLGLSCFVLITEDVLGSVQGRGQADPGSTCKRHVGAKGGNRSSTRLQWGRRPAPGEGESQGVGAGRGTGRSLSLQRGPRKYGELLSGGASGPTGAVLPETPAELSHPRRLFPRRSSERRSNGTRCRRHHRGGTRGPAGPPRTPHCPLKTLLTLSCRLSGSWQLSWWPDPNLLC